MSCPYPPRAPVHPRVRLSDPVYSDRVLSPQDLHGHMLNSQGLCTPLLLIPDSCLGHMAALSHLGCCLGSGVWLLCLLVSLSGAVPMEDQAVC